MPVVVTPEARSPVVRRLDVDRVTTTASETVAAWRDTDGVVVADTGDESLLDAIRAEPDGEAVPLLQIVADPPLDGPADATIEPDADADAARQGLDRARAGRDYRQAVGDLFEACRGRDIGQPSADLLELRRAADDAYDELDDLPPSAFHIPDR